MNKLTITKLYDRKIYRMLQELAEELRLRLYEYKVGIFKPRWFLMRRFGRFIALRSLVQRIQKKRTTDVDSFLTKTQANPSLFSDLNCQTIADNLEKDGYYAGFQLPESCMQEILSFAYGSSCCANRNSQLSFRYFEHRKAEEKFQTSVVTGDYFNAEAHCTAIGKIAQDSQLIEIAARYLGRKPAYLGSRLWWNFATEATSYKRRKAAQFFHYDLDDYCFLKYFFYLTDVTLRSGPHVYIVGTHHQKKLHHQLLRKRYPDAEIFEAYHQNNVRVLCGERGFGFVEDTFGFHKGLPPVTEDRLILQLEYAVHNYGM
ncbi:MAG: hypothetical protein SWJ54_07730 [Cyanobacteriota bacterium]|nr:hypothetical protein [Cyanobacteriota bacterium]